MFAKLEGWDGPWDIEKAYVPDFFPRERPAQARGVYEGV